MDLQERKIHFVQEFLKLKNEEIIHKLEDTLKIEKKKLLVDPAVPFTLVEFDKKIEDEEQALCLKAIGAALREEAA